MSRIVLIAFTLALASALPIQPPPPTSDNVRVSVCSMADAADDQNTTMERLPFPFPLTVPAPAGSQFGDIVEAAKVLADVCRHIEDEFPKPEWHHAQVWKLPFTVTVRRRDRKRRGNLLPQPSAIGSYNLFKVMHHKLDNDWGDVYLWGVQTSTHFEFDEVRWEGEGYWDPCE